MFALLIFPAVLLLIVLFTFAVRFTCVAPGYQAVTEEYGKFKRVLKPGWIMLGTFETLRHVYWSGLGEDANGRVIQRTMATAHLPVGTDQVYDVPPVVVQSKDGIAVRVNCALFSASSMSALQSTAPRTSTRPCRSPSRASCAPSAR